MPALPPPRTTELYYDGQWTSIKVRDTEPVKLTRGVGAEGNRPSPGSASATLDNRGGNYSPRNPNSPLYGKVGRNTPWRFAVDAGRPWLALENGLLSVSTPDSAALTVSGDLDVRIDAMLINWRSPQNLVSRYAALGGNIAWAFEMDRDGHLILVWSPTGLAVDWRYETSTIPVPAVAGQRLALRATLDVNNGASGTTVRFYYATTFTPDRWVQLGDTLTTAGTKSIFDGTSPLEIGSGGSTQVPDGTHGLAEIEGRVYAAQVRDGIDGVLIVDARPTADQDTAATVFTDETGLVWTLTGAATLSNRHVRMVGEVPAWPPSRDLSGADRTVQIEPAGIMRRLDAGNKPLDSALRRFILGKSPVECWPLTDGEQATQGAALYGSPPLTSTGDSAPQWGKGEIGNWIEPVLLCPTATFGILTATTTNTGASASWSVDMILTGRGYSEGLELSDQGLGTDGSPRKTWVIKFQAFLDQCQIFVDTRNDAGSSSAFLADVLSPPIFDGEPHHFRFSTTVGGSATGWAMYVDGAFVAGGAESFVGRALGKAEWLWSLADPESIEMSVGYLTCWDDTGPTPAEVYEAMMGFPGEHAATRVLRIAAERGVVASMVGDEEAGTRLGTQQRAKFLDLLQSVAATDLGYVLEKRDALELVYRGRETLYSQDPIITLDFAQGLIGAPFRPVDDDKLTVNDVTVKRDGGTSSTAVLETGRMSVLDPPDGVGRYDVERTLSLESDDQTGEHAYWRMHLGTYDGLRYTTITLDLGNPRVYALIGDIYRADVGDVMRLENLPADYGGGTVDLIIRGYSEEVGPSRWTISFVCEPGQPWQTGLVDDPVLGRADTDGSVLADAVTSTATTWPVTVTDGESWVTAAEFPFDVTAGGEQVTVTAITGAGPQTMTVTRSVNGIVKAHDAGADVRLTYPAIVAL